MFAEKPKGLKSKAKRRRTKDNPYEIYAAVNEHGQNRYFVYFRSGIYRGKWMDIGQEIYTQLNQFEKEDLCYMNELDRHRTKNTDAVEILNYYIDTTKETVEEAVIQSLQFQLIDQLLNRLPKKERRRIMLRYLYDLDLNAIASLEKCSPAAVHQSIAAGLKKIREWMAEL